MVLFDEAWSNTSRVTVMKCWKKSKSLSFDQVGYIENYIPDIAINQAEITGDINGPISTSEAVHVCNTLGVIQSLDVPNAPINSLLDD